MDLVPEDQRNEVTFAIKENTSEQEEEWECIVVFYINTQFMQIFTQREEELKKISLPLKINCFRTSIWDETLYKVCLSSF